MPDRETVINRVRAMREMATRDEGPEGRSAASMAERLVVQYGITDDELVEQEPNVFSGLFGYASAEDMVDGWLWFPNNIQPHVDAIARELDAAFEKMDSLSRKHNLDATIRLWRAYKDMLDNKYMRRDRESLTNRRNRIVKEWYDDLYAEHDAKWRDPAHNDDSEGIEANEAWIKVHAHNGAVEWLAVYVDLTKAQIESIVGQKADSLWTLYFRHTVCEVCGKNGFERDPKTHKYGDIVVGYIKSSTKVEDDTSPRGWRYEEERVECHPACAEEGWKARR